MATSELDQAFVVIQETTEKMLRDHIVKNSQLSGELSTVLESMPAKDILPLKSFLAGHSDTWAPKYLKKETARTRVALHDLKNRQGSSEESCARMEARLKEIQEEREIEKKRRADAEKAVKVQTACLHQIRGIFTHSNPQDNPKKSKKARENLRRSIIFTIDETRKSQPSSPAAPSARPHHAFSRIARENTPEAQATSTDDAQPQQQQHQHQPSASRNHLAPPQRDDEPIPRHSHVNRIFVTPRSDEAQTQSQAQAQSHAQTQSQAQVQAQAQALPPAPALKPVSRSDWKPVIVSPKPIIRSPLATTVMSPEQRVEDAAVAMDTRPESAKNPKATPQSAKQVRQEPSKAASSAPPQDTLAPSLTPRFSKPVSPNKRPPKRTHYAPAPHWENSFAEHSDERSGTSQAADESVVDEASAQAPASPPPVAKKAPPPVSPKPASPKTSPRSAIAPPPASPAAALASILKNNKVAIVPARSGSAEESGSAAAAVPTVAAAGPIEQPSSPPPKASSSPRKTAWTPPSVPQVKCSSCQKTVYLAERLDIDGQVFHKSCFTCCVCKTLLKPGNFAKMESLYYCKVHHAQRFKTLGKYSEGATSPPPLTPSAQKQPAQMTPSSGRPKPSVGFTLPESAMSPPQHQEAPTPAAAPVSARINDLMGKFNSPKSQAPFAPPATKPDGTPRIVPLSVNAIPPTDPEFAPSAPPLSPPISEHMDLAPDLHQAPSTRESVYSSYNVPAAAAKSDPGKVTLKRMHSADPPVGQQQQQQQQQPTARRAFPHIFEEKTASLRKDCMQCNKSIGTMHKYLKCAACSFVVHMDCEPTSDCGLEIPLSPKTKRGKGVSGCSSLIEACNEGEVVPNLIIACCKEIEDRGLRQEGIYRKPAQVQMTRDLQERFFIGKRRPNLGCYDDLHIVACCAKLFLENLEDPLMTARLTDSFLEAANTPDPRAEVLKILPSLPLVNFATLKFLIQHLSTVAGECGANKMDRELLAMVFAPVLFHTTYVDEGARVLGILFDLSPEVWSQTGEQIRSNPVAEPASPNSKKKASPKKSPFSFFGKK